MARTLAASAFPRIPVFLSRRFCAGLLAENMCRAYACLNLTLPVLVILKRLAAVRLVLIFGMVAKFFLSKFFLTRRQEHRHVAPFHPRRTFGLRDVGYLRDNSLDQRPPQFRMGDGAAPERNRELNTMTVSNKAFDVINFEVHIMDSGRGAHLDFLDHADGVLLGIVRLLLLRVAILVEVGDPAHRR